MVLVWVLRPSVVREHRWLDYDQVLAAFGGNRNIALEIIQAAPHRVVRRNDLVWVVEWHVVVSLSEGMEWYRVDADAHECQ